MSPQRSRWCSTGNLLSIGSFFLVLAMLAIGLVGPGCREQLTIAVDRNLPPETVLTGVPADSSTNFYQLHLFWNGSDQDGEVVGYDWAITDSLPPPDAIPWRYTTRTDSIFTFPVQEDREILGHRFYLRAVDNEGKRDPTPAFTFFAVRNNCVPVSWYKSAEAFGPHGERRAITSTDLAAPTDTIPAGWGVRFTWAGSDCDRAISPEGRIIPVGRVVGFDYKLGPVEMNWNRGAATDTLAAYDAAALRSELFEMRVRARDDAGLTGFDPAIRTFVWNYDPQTSFTRALLPGRPDSVPVFLASVTGPSGEYRPYAEGDTLPLTGPGMTMLASVRAVDPDPPYSVVAVQARLVKDADFWTDLTSSLSFTDLDRTHFTGDYRLMARSRDALDRWDGTPAEIRFSINKVARFRDSWTASGVAMTQRPVEGGVYASGGFDTLDVRFAAFDPDFIFLTTRLEFTYRWESYPLPDNHQGSESEFSVAWIVGSYTDADPVFAMRGARLPGAIPDVPGPVFLPGSYVLVIRARESYQNATDRDRMGYRIAEREVRFRLQ
jgi:hypothetical protein